ncbi:UNVERIFIED_ORG: hypothetical protein M2193_006224 [Bradyrhizobium japonicum]|uniref:Uncharacterized protein n=1 Tax=Bradyrhizobium diazoefficiens TaxID=1355477 RepID=A0A809ZPK5_9BRAD|nr:NodD2 [Bradyrhizobium japonicum SEMIA 5079]MBP1090098.1 hypothetical protein [Bradyrhizobium japonicum]BAL13079.1 transcriptional regulatory protein [Bradyrhizobium japonicum USDA 6]BBO08036.1 hypothetical protein SG09_73860 [Bradyrhizobium ottawaense]BBZ92459.1 hypothetical protein F07S3_22920 [Bradyrhizobium diazoefficiens]
MRAGHEKIWPDNKIDFTAAEEQLVFIGRRSQFEADGGGFSRDACYDISEEHNCYEVRKDDPESAVQSSWVERMSGHNREFNVHQSLAHRSREPFRA